MRVWRDQSLVKDELFNFAPEPSSKHSCHIEHVLILSTLLKPSLTIKYEGSQCIRRRPKYYVKNDQFLDSHEREFDIVPLGHNAPT